MATKLTSEHYEEQIRNLEKEQAKILGTEIQHDEENFSHVPEVLMSDTLNQMRGQNSLQDVKIPSRFFMNTSSLPSSAHTPDVLQLRLAQKIRENEILQSKLDATKISASSNCSTETTKLGAPRHKSSVGLPRSRSLTSFPNIQSTIDVHMLPQMTTQHEKESLKERLHHSQLHIDHLNGKLKECADVCKQQKNQFRQAVEELQTKLTETIVERDSILEMRRSEADDKEKMIKMLELALKKAEEDSMTHEQMRCESASKVEVLQSSLTTSNAALDQIHHQIQAENERRGKDLIPKSVREGRDICKTSEMLRMLFEDSQAEVSELRETLLEKISKLNTENESYETKLHSIQTDSRNKICQLSEEYEKQMNALTERAMNARKQSLSLQSQLTQLQEMMQEKLDQKEHEVKTLEQQLQQVKQSNQEMLTNCSQRNNSLSSEIERYRNQVKSLDDERDSLQANILELTEQVEKQKDALFRAEEEISSGRDQNNRLWRMEEENNKRIEELQSQLENKLIEIADLHRSMESLKEESKKNLLEKMNSVEKELQKSAQDQANDLNSQYQKLMIMYQKQTEEKNQQKATLDTLLEHKTKSEESLAEAHNELKKCNSESQAFRLHLEEKERDFQILKQERDHYFDLLKERNEDVNEMKALNDKLHIKVNEGKKHFEAFQKQNANFSQWVQMNSQTTNDVKEEKEKLTKLLEEMTIDNQEMKKANDDLRKRLKANEKKLVLLNNENEEVKISLKEKMKELDNETNEKEKMFIELKEARYEVASLTEENDHQKSELKVTNKKLSEDKQRYKAKIVALDNELTAAHSALTASKSAHAKAMQVAEKMQKEVALKRSQIDSMLSKIHWLEESLEAAHKENNSLQSTKDKFHLRCSRLAGELEKISLKLEDARIQNTKQAAYITKLEVALDKAASLHADVKTAAENQEQDMTRTKLRFSLEIKELQQALDAAMKTNKALSQSSKKITTKEPTTKTKFRTRAESANQPVKKTVKKSITATQNNDIPENKEKMKADGEMNSELRHILDEMKMMIANGIGNHHKGSINVNHSNSQHQTSEKMKSYTKQSSRVLQTHGSQELNSATPPEKLEAFDSPLHASSPFNSMDLVYDTATDSHQSMPKSSALSPVEKLLLQPNVGLYQPNQRQLHTRMEKIRNQQKHNRYPNPSLDTDDTSSSLTSSCDTGIQASNQQHSLKRLEEQLQSLSKIGGNLKQENKAMASLIQNQGIKLKKCRQHERQLKVSKTSRKQTHS